MADTKKGGNSIVWSWREVGVENCTCMSVEAGMYCGPERTPGIANDSTVESSCGHHCWDLGYVDAETEYFISKGFPLCGGPDAPPLPDPILWPEFPLDNANRDGVPPCQQRATQLAFKQQAGLQAELQQVLFENAVIEEPVIRAGDPPSQEAVVANRLKHRTIVHRGCALGTASCPCKSPVTGGTMQGCPAGQVCISVQSQAPGGPVVESEAKCCTQHAPGTPGDSKMQKWLRLNESTGWGVWDKGDKNGWVTPGVAPQA